MPEMPSRPALMAEQILDLIGGQPVASRDVGHDARIEIAGSRAHDDAAEGREAHAGVDAASARDRREARAVPEMRQHDRAVGGLSARPRRRSSCSRNAYDRP